MWMTIYIYIYMRPVDNKRRDRLIRESEAVCDNVGSLMRREIE